MEHPTLPTTTAELVDCALDRFARATVGEQGGEIATLPLTTVFTAQMRGDDALAVNHAAMHAGFYFVKLRKTAADYEAGRKEFLLSIADEYVQAGQSNTAAEASARADERYIAYVQKGNDLAYERDVAEVIYDSLKAHAAALRRGPQIEAHGLAELLGAELDREADSAPQAN